jgi:hypothetical protein
MMMMKPICQCDVLLTIMNLWVNSDRRRGRHHHAECPWLKQAIFLNLFGNDTFLVLALDDGPLNDRCCCSKTLLVEELVGFGTRL